MVYELGQVDGVVEGGEVLGLHWEVVGCRVLKSCVSCLKYSEGLTGIFCVEQLIDFVALVSLF